MIGKYELQRWLDTLPADDCIYIDEGGLSLLSETGASIEIGGIGPDSFDETGT